MSSFNKYLIVTNRSIFATFISTYPCFNVVSRGIHWSFLTTNEVISSYTMRSLDLNFFTWSRERRRLSGTTTIWNTTRTTGLLFTRWALAIPWRDWAKDKAIESVVPLQPMGIEWQVVMIDSVSAYRGLLKVKLVYRFEEEQYI